MVKHLGTQTFNSSPLLIKLKKNQQTLMLAINTFTDVLYNNFPNLHSSSAVDCNIVFSSSPLSVSVLFDSPSKYE